MNKLAICLISFLGVLILTTEPAFSETPDGVTPANEGVCDEVMGATPGLYGLCVAYCEAQDAAEIVNLDELDALKAPSRNILKNYERRMKPGDPQMPCVNYVSACPVFNAEDLAKINFTIGDRYEDDYRYTQTTDGSLALRESVRSIIYAQFLPFYSIGPSIPVVSAFILDRGDGTYSGLYFDSTVSPTIIRSLPLTLEEYNGCELAIITNILDEPTVEFCGDGIRTRGPEECDDGNNDDGDGCSAACTLEL